MDKIIPCYVKLLLAAFNILAGDRQITHEDDDQNSEYYADRSISHAKSTQAMRFPKPVGKRSTQRARYDIGKPESKNLVQAEQKVANCRYSDYYHKQHG